MIQSSCGLGLIAPELCQKYVQQQAEETGTISLIQAKPTIVNKPVASGSVSPDGGYLCAFNRWVSDHPLWAGLGLIASFFLLRRKP